MLTWAAVRGDLISVVNLVTGSQDLINLECSAQENGVLFCPYEVYCKLEGQINRFHGAEAARRCQPGPLSLVF